MARYIAQFRFDGRYTDMAFNEIKSFLEFEGFEYTEYKGEYVFQRGQGWLVSPTFVKIGFNGNLMQFETWLKYAILPGVFLGEFGLEGFVGSAVKGKMKKVVATIPAIMQRYPLLTPYPTYTAPTQPYGQPAYPQQPMYAQPAPQPVAPATETPAMPETPTVEAPVGVITEAVAEAPAQE